MALHELTYAFDAYCGWCYGFGPAVHRFADEHGDRIRVRVLSGGLFIGERALPVGAFPHIAGANARIAVMTGVRFGEPYQRLLADGTTVMDSTMPAIGLIALRRQAPEQALAFTADVQNAWYRDGRSLGQVDVYTQIADQYGLDADQVARDFADPATRAEAQRDFVAVRRLGVAEYPTLLVHTARGAHRLGGVRSTPADLAAALDAYAGDRAAA